MPVVAKTLRPCLEPKSTISGWTLISAHPEMLPYNDENRLLNQ
jgi:hypothetical protein